MQKLLLLISFSWAGVCAAELTLLLKMLPVQQAFFVEHILKPFEEKHRCKIRVESYADPAEMAARIEANNPPVDVIKVPMSMAGVLAGKGMVLPLSAAGKAGFQKKLQETFFLMNLGTFRDTLFFLPRKFETRLMVYRKSKVREAVEHWRPFEGTLNGTLKSLMLPPLGPAYTLEADPAQWDYRDLLVAGFYWAKTGEGQGKIAHRGKRYGGTALDLFDRALQLGASQTELSTLASPALVEVLRWESLFTRLGVYPKAMRLEGWDGEGLWKAFGENGIYLSFLTQIDCYFLHGTAEPGMPGFMKDRDDLGFCPMPLAVRLADGSTVSRATSTGGWFWGVGARARDPKLAMELLLHITNYGNQLSESDRFGMIPVRKDILGSTSPLFSESWKVEVFRASLEQLKLNGKSALPVGAHFDRLEGQLLDLWEKVASESAKRLVTAEEIGKWAAERMKTDERELRQERLPGSSTP